MHGNYALGGYVPDVLGATEEPTRAPPSDAISNFDADAYWMREVLRASMEGCGVASPNPSVGCLLVANGVEVARGCTQSFGGLHGERVAFERVSAEISWADVTAYVALEPCAHQGKQPPCADLFVEKRPGRIVVGIGDPFDAVDGAGFARMRAAGLRVEEGPLAREIALWLSPFLLSVKRERVVLAAKWAQSLDGCLAEDSGVSRWITGPEARRYTHWLRRKYDAILVGAGTLLGDAPRLDVRLEDSAQTPTSLPQPLRLAFDPSARLLHCDEETKRRLRSGTLLVAAPLIVIASHAAHSAALADGAPRAWHEELLAAGVTFETYAHAAPLEGLLSILNGVDFSPLRPGPYRNRPVQSVLVEGGATLLNALMAAGAIDFCHAMVAPLFLGGSKNRLGKSTSLAEAERFVPVASFSAGADLVWEFLPRDRYALLEECWRP